MTGVERELWLARRRALLLEVRAIEKVLDLPQVTVKMERKEAEKLGLLIESASAAQG